MAAKQLVAYFLEVDINMIELEDPIFSAFVIANKAFEIICEIENDPSRTRTHGLLISTLDFVGSSPILSLYSHKISRLIFQILLLLKFSIAPIL